MMHLPLSVLVSIVCSKLKLRLEVSLSLVIIFCLIVPNAELLKLNIKNIIKTLSATKHLFYQHG